MSHLKEAIRLTAFARMKERSRRAWHDRHCPNCNEAEPGAFAIRLRDLLAAAREDGALEEVIPTITKLN